jgi:hypothetical protein
MRIEGAGKRAWIIRNGRVLECLILSGYVNFSAYTACPQRMLLDGVFWLFEARKN